MVQVYFYILNHKFDFEPSIIITNYVCSTREGNVFIDVCPAVHRGGGGVFPVCVLFRSYPGEGYPDQRSGLGEGVL